MSDETEDPESHFYCTVSVPVEPHQIVFVFDFECSTFGDAKTSKVMVSFWIEKD